MPASYVRQNTQHGSYNQVLCSTFLSICLLTSRTDSMSYSFTEKKRIRKSFAKRASVLPIPFLLATQIESYAAFLQAQVEPDHRATEGLQAAFMSIFPIESHSKNARLDFVNYVLGSPPFDVKECQQRGLT